MTKNDDSNRPINQRAADLAVLYDDPSVAAQRIDALYDPDGYLDRSASKRWKRDPKRQGSE